MNELGSGSPTIQYRQPNKSDAEIAVDAEEDELATSGLTGLVGVAVASELNRSASGRDSVSSDCDD